MCRLRSKKEIVEWQWAYLCRYALPRRVSSIKTEQQHSIAYEFVCIPCVTCTIVILYVYSKSTWLHFYMIRIFASIVVVIIPSILSAVVFIMVFIVSVTTSVSLASAFSVVSLSLVIIAVLLRVLVQYFVLMFIRGGLFRLHVVGSLFCWPILYG